MSRKIITFLGATPATSTTTYFFKDKNGEQKKYEGKVFSEALRQFCEYDSMLVCVTEKAKTVNWSVLEELNDPKFKQLISLLAMILPKCGRYSQLLQSILKGTIM